LLSLIFLLASNGFFTGFFNPVCDFFTGLFSLLLDTLAQLATRHKKAPLTFAGLRGFLRIHKTVPAEVRR